MLGRIHFLSPVKPSQVPADLLWMNLLQLSPERFTRSGGALQRRLPARLSRCRETLDLCLSGQITTCGSHSRSDRSASFLEKLQCFWFIENTIENKRGVQMYGQCWGSSGGSTFLPFQLIFWEILRLI